MKALAKMPLTPYPDLTSEPYRSIWIECPSNVKKEGYVCTLRGCDNLQSWLGSAHKFTLAKTSHRAAKFLQYDADAVAAELDKDGHIARIGAPGSGMPYLN